MDGAPPQPIDPGRIPEDMFGDTRGVWTVRQRPGETGVDLYDLRLDITWRVNRPFFDALIEVSSQEDAHAFAHRNGFKIAPNRGLVSSTKAAAELRILTTEDSLPPGDSPEEWTTRELWWPDGMKASVGPPSFLFERLVWSPAQSHDPSLPDAVATRTLALTQCPLEEVSDRAELAVLALRELHPDLLVRTFSFPAPRHYAVPHPRVQTFRPGAWGRSVALYNRGVEEPDLSGYLYFYRVLESFFDRAWSDKFTKWRVDTNLTNTQLAKLVKSSTAASADLTLLEDVLRVIDWQVLAYEAHASGWIKDQSLTALAAAIYARRNAIAHARQAEGSLIPFSFGIYLQPEEDQRWWDLLRRASRAALQQFALEPG